MLVDKIYVMKESNSEATVSIRFSIDDEDYLIISGMILDLNDIASPLRSLKANGQEVIRGPIFDQLSASIVGDFITIREESNGLYIIDSEKIIRG